MEKGAHYFLVGIFVSISLAALTGFIIWLMAGGRHTRHPDHYTVYFTDPVSGLEEGGAVEYKGVEVGKIMELRLTPGRPELVKVDVEVDNKTPVRAGTKVALEMRGITGLVSLQMVTEPGDNRPPERRDGEKYPVLEGAGSQWAKAMQDLPLITKQMKEVSGKINAFLNKKNMTSLDQSVSNVEQMSREMQGMAESIRRTSEKLNQDPSQILYQPSKRGVEIPK
jgi:phospholipid/cholesterol/gamma-HCH transport system substrate-binding protein